ncbi:MAG: hypothetical protein AB9915_03905 [Candidatus Dojkabacteria bacterium]
MIILPLLILLLCITPIHADDFSNNGDSVNNSYFQTVAFTVESFPPICTEEQCIDYNESLVQGEDTSNVLSNMPLSSIADFGYMRRIPMVADRVKGPPGTIIDILYYYLNNTGHSINISKIIIPYSKNEYTLGNIPNLVNFANDQPIHGSVDVLFNNHTLRREGYLKEYVGMGILNNGVSGAEEIDEMYISNPIKIDTWSVEESNGVLTIKVWIQNNSEEYLNNMTFEHMGYTENFDIQAHNEKLLQYTLENVYHGEEFLDLGYFQINNPNTKTECVVQGANYYNWLQSGAVTVLAYREDGGWVNGAYVQPSQESFCVERIPYKMNSETVYYEKKEEENMIDTQKVEEDVKSELSSDTVLGVSDSLKILPQTAKSNSWIFLFLVVDAYLWYSFLTTRRKYESKNNNTRVCTKDSKNSH